MNSRFHRLDLVFLLFGIELGVGEGWEARERKAPHLVEVNGIAVTVLLGL